MLEFLQEIWIWIPIGITIGGTLLILLDRFFRRFEKIDASSNAFTVKYTKALLVFISIPLVLLLAFLILFAIVIIEEVIILQERSFVEALFYEAEMLIVMPIVPLYATWFVHAISLRIHIDENSVLIVRAFRKTLTRL